MSVNINDNFETGKVIVALRNAKFCPVSMTDILQIANCESADIIFPFKHGGLPVGDILRLEFKCQKKETVLQTIDKLSAHPHVHHAEPNYIYDRHKNEKYPNDPFFSRMWGMRQIHAPQAWTKSTGSADVVVAVADSGVDYLHPDIESNMWVSKDNSHGWNFINNNNDPMDFTGHGTHIAGTIGAVGNNGIGTAGVCWRVKIAALRIGNVAFSLDAAIESLQYANENNIQIHNNSWGGRYYSPSLKHAIEQYNGLFIASAGNDGVDNDLLPDYPASFDSPNIISVAAINPYGMLAPFSNYGLRSVDIAAPGTDIFSLTINGKYDNKSGTSMATPHVAGAAALLKSYKPHLTHQQIKAIILSSVDKDPNLVGKIATGGVLNLDRMMRE